MKAFVYTKNNTRLHKILEHVVAVNETKEKICFTFEDTSTYEADKKIYKTTTYQN